MDTVQTTTARPHIVWLDVLRLVAILMVIAIHCTDPFNASPESRANPEFNFWGSVYGSMLRASVPLFVMMTGFLLLPVRQEASAFYKKRIPRVLFPFLIWSVLFDLAPWFIQWIGGSPELVTDFFPWEPNPSASFVEALKTIALIPVTFTVYATPMWYIYVLIGLYLYMPVFSAWVEKASERAKAYVSGVLVYFVVYPLSDGVCFALPVRNLLMEFIRSILLFCRFQRLFAVRTLFREKNGLVAWQDFLGDGSAVFSWLFYYISRFSLYDIRSERERGGDGVVLYLLFA